MNAREMIERANRLEFNQELVFSGGDKFEFRFFRCKQDPRLTVLHRYDCKLETVTQTWQVDGVDHANSKSAFGALVVSDDMAG